MEVSWEERRRVTKRRPLERLSLSGMKYLAVLRVSAVNRLAYLWAVVFRAFFLIVVVYILSQLWRVTFALHGSLLPGFTVNSLVWYLAAAETIALSMPALSDLIDQEVRSGELAYLLGRPCSYIFYNYARYLGERCINLLLNGLVAACLALLIAGPPGFGWQGVLIWPLMALLAISIEFVCYFAIGLLAFWTESTKSFSFIFSRLTLVLGGVLAPIDVFPQPLRSIAQILPFSTILYGPARMLIHFEGELFGRMLLQQVVTLVVAGLLLLLLYTLASRRVSINGG